MTAMEVGQSSELLLTLTGLLAKGLPLERVLPMFTSNVATLLRLKNRGRIVPGHYADLLMLDDGNNLQDVMINGRWHRRDGRQVIHGEFENTQEN